MHLQKIGDRPLTYKDKKSMPYYNATNCEIFRYCNPGKRELKWLNSVFLFF